MIFCERERERKRYTCCIRVAVRVELTLVLLNHFCRLINNSTAEISMHTYTHIFFYRGRDGKKGRKSNSLRKVKTAKSHLNFEGVLSHLVFSFLFIRTGVWLKSMLFDICTKIRTALCVI